MSWDSIDLSKIGDRPPVEPTVGRAGLLYPGKRHLITGSPESAKTLYAYIVALETIREGDKVTLLDFEMGPWDARDRLRELGATDDELTDALNELEAERSLRIAVTADRDRWRDNRWRETHGEGWPA